MAYVPDCEHDVFISYARIDDEPLIAGEAGWVTGLVAKLETVVRQKLGSKDLRVWMDRELAGNAPLTPALLGTLRTTAALVVIMSPGYLASPWCARERDTFLEVVRGHREEESRVFLVHQGEVDRSAMSRDFQDLIGYPFWVTDARKGSRTLGTPVPTKEEVEYWNRLNALGTDLARLLKRLKGTAGAPATPPSGPIGFLAEATEDLDARWQEVRRYLNQAGVQVLPETYYPRGDAAAFTQALQADLPRCKLFVQLLSGVPGRKLAGATLGYPALQYQLAQAAALPILQWRSRDVDVAAVDDADHRALLEGVTVRACGIEEFKQAAVEEALRPLAPAPPPSRDPEDLIVFVNTDAPDRPLAQRVADLLLEQGVGYTMPLGQGRPDEIRLDLQENLRSCDGVLFIYGGTSPSWVRNQVLQGRKIMSRREERARAIGVVDGPPPDKAALDFALPDLLRFDCRQGVSPGAVRQFIETLRTPPRG